MDLRKIIIDDLDPTNSRVEFSTKPIVLLCGGFVPPPKNNPDDPDPVPISIRHRIVNSFLDYEIFRPEEIDNWHADGIFSNLLDYESDLAGICSLVVIVLESAGAIAELGAFSQLDDLKKKLVVFVSDKAEEISFINLGILRYISRSHASGVRRHPWDYKSPATAKDQVIIDIIDDIKEEIENLHKTEAVKVQSDAHVMAIIFELTRLCIALKEIEILEAVKALGRELRKEDIRRKLFLLQRFGFINKISYSDSDFYTAADLEFHRVKFSLKSGKNYDQVGSRLDLLRYYKETKAERNRARAIEKAKMGAEK